MRPVAVLSPLVALLALAVTPAAAEESRVTILHTTDVHGSLLPWDDLADRPAPRGLAKIATLIARARAEGPPVLLLDAGDATSGSPMTGIWHRDPAGLPEPVTAVMNALRYDAMALGNHEFDFGPAALESTRAAARFPWLAANVSRADGSPAFAPSIVRELPGGIRIGILGLCTSAVPQLADPSQVAGYTFLPPVEIAQREVDRLRGAGHCDAVIAIAHTGLERDTREGDPRPGDAPGENVGWQLAHELRGLDLLILGHTHAVVPYLNVDGTPVTQAGKAAEALGRVDLTFTRDSPAGAWKLGRARTSVLAVGDTTATDPGIAALLEPYARRTRAALDEVVATASARLDAPYGRFADGALWQIIHRAQRAATGADVSLAALFDPAQRIEAGPVRVRDLLRLYPYENTLVTLEMGGEELKAALERSARYLAPYTYEDDRPLTEPGRSGFNFDMASGLYYDVDLTRPVGERIVHLSWNGRPLTPGLRLKVVVNGYRAAGGGDFPTIRAARRLATLDVHAADALIAYVRRAGTLTATFDDAWSLIPDYAGTPERPLIDRLVRLGLAPRSEVAHLVPGEPARRVDVAYWLARAFDWRSKRPSGAFGDVGDSLQPWVDGLVARGIPGRDSQGERFQPFLPASFATILEWCTRAAQREGLRFGDGAGAQAALGRSLLSGASLEVGPAPGAAALAMPTRAQWLGMLSNLRFPVVRVIETTDFHGAILGGSRERRTNRPTGGTPALAATLERLRAENPEGTVLVDGGDLFQGTMISNLQFGRPVVEQMNRLGYSAAAIGNHEFDWSLDTLRSRVMDMRFAALGANVSEVKSGRRPRWMRADTIVTRRGVRVGVFGLAYPGTPRVTLPANVATLRFADDSAAAAREAPALRRAGASIVVEVGHIPAETDSTRHARGDLARLANGVPGVDAWFGGHSHNLVDDRIRGVPVLIASALGQWVAVVDFAVDPLRRTVVERRQRVVPVYADGPVDSAWTVRVERWNAGVAPIAAQVIGRNDHALTRGRPEATIGDLITDAMRFQSACDVALQNPGGMRADLDAGPVTRGKVYAVMPFDNTIVMLELTGAELRRAVEQALRFDRITQASGVRYRIDMAKPPMQRVVTMTLADGSPLDEAKVYRVAVNNFMSTGGDDYDALSGGRSRNDTGLLIRGAIEAYVRDRCKGGLALDVQTDGRIELAGR